MEDLLNKYTGLVLVKGIGVDKILFDVESKKILGEETKKKIINEVYKELVGNWSRYLVNYNNIEKRDNVHMILLW